MFSLFQTQGATLLRHRLSYEVQAPYWDHTHKQKKRRPTLHICAFYVTYLRAWLFMLSQRQVFYSKFNWALFTMDGLLVIYSLFFFFLLLLKYCPCVFCQVSLCNLSEGLIKWWHFYVFCPFWMSSLDSWFLFKCFGWGCRLITVTNERLLQEEEKSREKVEFYCLC